MMISRVHRRTPTGTHEVGKTIGVSPKTALAGIVPAVGTILAVVVTGLITGEFDRTEEVEAATGLVAAVVAAASAYLGSPGDVVYAPTVPKKRKRT
jgi:hypothetical protein